MQRVVLLLSQVVVFLGDAHSLLALLAPVDDEQRHDVLTDLHLVLSHRDSGHSRTATTSSAAQRALLASGGASARGGRRRRGGRGDARVPGAAAAAAAVAVAVFLGAGIAGVRAPAAVLRKVRGGPPPLVLLPRLLDAVVVDASSLLRGSAAVVAAAVTAARPRRGSLSARLLVSPGTLVCGQPADVAVSAASRGAIVSPLG